MILVDEAYFHFADSPDYESVIPLVKQYPNLIVARTVSRKVLAWRDYAAAIAWREKETH